MTDNVAKARAAWGEPPAWVLALAQACDASSQVAVARRIAYSPPTVSQVISNTYRGDLVRLEAAVSGIYLAATVDCPVLGEMARNVCLEWQERPYTDASSLHIRMWRACKQCSQRVRKAQEDAA